jgi:drug/metabolite transporter (DMT)-like permease
VTPTIQGIFFGLGAGAFWGLSFLIPKLFGDLTPGLLALSRCGGFALIASVVLLRSRSVSVLWGRHWRMALWLSITGYSVYYYLLIFSIRYAGIPVSSLIIGLLPLTISLASRDTVRRKGLFRLSMGMIGLGILLLNVDGLRSLPLDPTNQTAFFLGVFLSVISLASWTCFSVQNSRYLKAHREIDSAQWAAVLGVFSLLTMAPIALFDVWRDSHSIHADFTLLLHILVAMGILGFGCSYIASVMWNVASKNLPTAVTGQLIVSETVFALLYGYLFHGMPPGPLEFVCIVLLVGGVVMGVRSF